jgi:hypothetical protein
MIIMSFGFLPLLTYLTLCFVLAIILAYIIGKRWNKDRKGLIVLYLTIMAGVLLVVVIKMLKETTNIYYKYFSNMGYILLGFIAVFVIELFYLSVTHKGSVMSKKLILTGWGFIIGPLFLALISYLMLD